MDTPAARDTSSGGTGTEAGISDTPAGYLKELTDTQVRVPMVIYMLLCYMRHMLLIVLREASHRQKFNGTIPYPECRHFSSLIEPHVSIRTTLVNNDRIFTLTIAILFTIHETFTSVPVLIDIFGPIMLVNSFFSKIGICIGVWTREKSWYR